MLSMWAIVWHSDYDMMLDILDFGVLWTGAKEKVGLTEKR